MTPGFDEISPYLFFPLCLPLVLSIAALVLAGSASHQHHLLLVSQLYRAHVLLQAAVFVTISFVWKATAFYHIAGADSSMITVTSGSHRHLFTYCLATMAQAALPVFAFLAAQWSLAMGLTSVGKRAATSNQSYRRGRDILPTSSRSGSFSGEMNVEPREAAQAGSEQVTQQERATTRHSRSQPAAELSGTRAAEYSPPLTRSQSLAVQNAMELC